MYPVIDAEKPEARRLQPRHLNDREPVRLSLACIAIITASLALAWVTWPSHRDTCAVYNEHGNDMKFEDFDWSKVRLPSPFMRKKTSQIN